MDILNPRPTNQILYQTVCNMDFWFSTLASSLYGVEINNCIPFIFIKNRFHLLSDSTLLHPCEATVLIIEIFSITNSFCLAESLLNVTKLNVVNYMKLCWWLSLRWIESSKCHMTLYIIFNMIAENKRITLYSNVSKIMPEKGGSMGSEEWQIIFWSI